MKNEAKSDKLKAVSPRPAAPRQAKNRGQLALQKAERVFHPWLRSTRTGIFYKSPNEIWAFNSRKIRTGRTIREACAKIARLIGQPLPPRTEKKP